MHRYRTHTCGALRDSDIGQDVRLSGWCHRIRDHGGVLFIDLRDHYGLTQVVADPDSPAFKVAETLRSEWVVRIDGKVRRRPDGTHDVVIEGVARSRLEELEPSDRGYRRVRLSVLPEVGVDRIASSSMSALVTCAQSLASMVRRKHPDFSLDLERFDSPSSLVDALAHRLVLSPEERQRLLETIDVRVRVARLLEIVGDIVLRFGGRGGVAN